MTRAPVASLLAVACTAATAFAAPWSLWRGEGYLSMGAAFTHHEEVVLYNGRHMRVGDFEFLSYGLALQYGLTDRLAATVSAPYEVNDGESAMAPEVRGVGDIRLGVRGTLFEERRGRPALAASLGLKLPGSDYRTDVLTAPGDGQRDIETRLLCGKGFALAGRPGTWEIEAGYRFRAGSPGDEIVLYGALSQEIARPLTARLFLDITDQRSGFGIGEPGWTEGDFPAVEEDIARVGLGTAIRLPKDTMLDIYYASIVRAEGSAPGWHLGMSVVLHRLGF